MHHWANKLPSYQRTKFNKACLSGMELNNYGNIVLGLHLGKTVSMWKSLLVSLQHNAEFTRTHRPMFSGCPLQKLHYNALTICALAMSATTRSLKDNLNQAGLQVYQTCSPSQWIQSNFLYPTFLLWMPVRRFINTSQYWLFRHTSSPRVKKQASDTSLKWLGTTAGLVTVCCP